MDIGPDSVLDGSRHHDLIPTSLNLEPLPFEATAIVCMVANPLAGGHSLVQTIDMSYLSNAKAGTVMVDESDMKIALLALRVGEDEAIES